MDELFRYAESDPDSLAPTWNARRIHSLTWQSGWDLAALLDEWEPRLTGLDDPDTAAMVVIPSHDTTSAAPLVQHHFAPLLVVASRAAGREFPPGSSDVEIRPVGDADVDVAVELNMETVRFDEVFGLVSERPNSEELLRKSITEMLDRPDECTWLAWLDGEPVGLVYVDLPPYSDWIQRYSEDRPLGYLGEAGVRADVRGRGIGSALVAQAHRALDDAGVARTLLHHALPNPRSTPFWYTHGYRPAWTFWVRRPALRSSSGVAP